MSITNMKILNQLIHRRAKTFLGETVKECDTLSFVNSDGIECRAKIMRRSNGTLYFWNTSFEIMDYTTAKEVK